MSVLVTGHTAVGGVEWSRAFRRPRHRRGLQRCSQDDVRSGRDSRAAINDELVQRLPDSAPCTSRSARADAEFGLELRMSQAPPTTQRGHGREASSYHRRRVRSSTAAHSVITAKPSLRSGRGCGRGHRRSAAALLAGIGFTKLPGRRRGRHAVNARDAYRGRVLALFSPKPARPHAQPCSAPLRLCDGTPWTRPPISPISISRSGGLAVLSG